MKQVSDARYLDYDAIGVGRPGGIGIARPIERDGIGDKVAAADKDVKTIKLGRAIEGAVLDAEPCRSRRWCPSALSFLE
jgi:hypothetical protein